MAFTGIRRGWQRIVNAGRTCRSLILSLALTRFRGQVHRAWYTRHDRMNQQRQLIARLAPLESVGTTPRECADNKSICPVVGGISSAHNPLSLSRSFRLSFYPPPSLSHSPRVFSILSLVLHSFSTVRPSVTEYPHSPCIYLYTSIYLRY